MDDQNQPMNQPNDPMKKSDVTSSAPVEMEPETGVDAPSPTVQTAGTVSSPTPTPAPTPTTPASTAPTTPDTTPSDPLAQLPTEPALPVGQQPNGLLEAPKKKSMAFMVLIVVVLVIALAALGYMIYKML